MAEHYHYQTISGGEILRHHVTIGDTLGLQIKDLVMHGILVDDDLLLPLVAEAVSQVPIDVPIIFDGIPRTLYQAGKIERICEAQGRTAPLVIYLNVQKQTVYDRLAKRGREDDKLDIIERRFEVFAQHVLPVIHHYQKLGRLVEINAEDDVAHITKQIEHIIGRT